MNIIQALVYFQVNSNVFNLKEIIFQKNKRELKLNIPILKRSNNKCTFKYA